MINTNLVNLLCNLVSKYQFQKERKKVPLKLNLWYTILKSNKFLKTQIK